MDTVRYDRSSSARSTHLISPVRSCNKYPRKEIQPCEGMSRQNGQSPQTVTIHQLTLPSTIPSNPIVSSDSKSRHFLFSRVLYCFVLGIHFVIDRSELQDTLMIVFPIKLRLRWVGRPRLLVRYLLVFTLECWLPLELGRTRGRPESIIKHMNTFDRHLAGIRSATTAYFSPSRYMSIAPTGKVQYRTQPHHLMFMVLTACRSCSRPLGTGRVHALVGSLL